jgi:hypothetical protein
MLPNIKIYFTSSPNSKPTKQNSNSIKTQNRNRIEKEKNKIEKRGKELTWPQPTYPAQLASPPGAQAAYRFSIDRQVGPIEEDIVFKLPIWEVARWCLLIARPRQDPRHRSPSSTSSPPPPRQTLGFPFPLLPLPVHLLWTTIGTLTPAMPSCRRLRPSQAPPWCSKGLPRRLGPSGRMNREGDVSITWSLSFPSTRLHRSSWSCSHLQSPLTQLISSSDSGWSSASLHIFIASNRHLQLEFDVRPPCTTAVGRRRSCSDDHRVAAIVLVGS